VSHDPRANTALNKYTSICELAPICRDDLVILPKSLSKSLGGIGPLVLVYKVTQFVHIVDIHTMRTHEIASSIYWEHLFKAVAGRERLTEFLILSVEELDA